MEESDIKNDPLMPSADESLVSRPDVKNYILLQIKSFFRQLSDNERFISTLKKSASVVAVLSGIILFLLTLLYIIPALQEIPSGGKSPVENSVELKKETAYKKQITQLNRDVQRLTKRYAGYTSGQSYLVVNTTDNLFYLYRNKKLIREGHCSSGSYKLLKTEEGRSWLFKTPKGKFRIQGKTINPTWRRPDWAFVEEGLPIPPKEHFSRYEYGVLGNYALALGDGYLIHGTLYKRFLGMPVTHGCVRLNDEDLEAVFRNLGIGSKVYIY